MKTIPFLKRSAISLLIILGGSAFAEPPVVKEGLTSAQLLLARRQADAQDPMRRMEASAVQDPSVVNRPKSLLGESDIISFGNFATLVPKRAILQIPENYADRIQMKPGAALQSWRDFYALNRSWITTVEVTRVQAEVNEDIAAETKTQMVKTGNLVIATYLGGPISVLPLKVPVEKITAKMKP
jgi:hypothetical protein